jgi:hypothetical protein
MRSAFPQTQLPYNRIVQSAGRVFSFGNPDLENHALDITVLPGQKQMAIEDRYGIVVFDRESESIVFRWTFDDSNRFKGMESTYSGICSFEEGGKIFIAWGAAGGGNQHSALILAEWDGHGQKIATVSEMPFDKNDKADWALPNQVVANRENGDLFLYLVLNGNDRLLKIRFSDRSIVWSVPTGVAPYGICISGDQVYVSNWAGPQVSDTTRENAGTPWGRAYTNPQTGATANGSLSIFKNEDGSIVKEMSLGLHPNAMVSSRDGSWLFVANANSDEVRVINLKTLSTAASFSTGLFSGKYHYYGSSPDALALDEKHHRLYVGNAMDNAVAVIELPENEGQFKESRLAGYIPTEAYPSGIVIQDGKLYVTNLEARGAGVLSVSREFSRNRPEPIRAYSIHKEMASFSEIPIPETTRLNEYTLEVRRMNLLYRSLLSVAAPRQGIKPRPVPERIGEPSVFKHVIYIIKENKTYDQVFGDIEKGRGDKDLCVFGENITPNQHKLASEFCLLDNYFASGKCSAEGHQWTDAAMVSDYVERNVRAWFRSYPHRQEDALVYNKNGFIWNDALDHGKKVRIYGEACTTHYRGDMSWLPIYRAYQSKENLGLQNTSTIARIRPIIHPEYPDCDNISFSDQIRADAFIAEWKKFEEEPGDSLPDLMVLSMPDDHSAGTSEKFPKPEAMVADNDLALGRMVETITHSRFWNSTVIFVTEDDSQSGWDHVSPYRTTCQVISAYSHHGLALHTDYNQTSMVRTIEQILGIPPMNVLDATASPMFDCFIEKKSAGTFTHLQNNIPLDLMNKPMASLNGKALYYAKLSLRVYKDLDGGDDRNMNRIIWYSMKGEEKYPGTK